jgi:hypothetical protein
MYLYLRILDSGKFFYRIGARYEILFKSLLKQFYILKSSISWDNTLCGPLKVNQQFGGTRHLDLHGRIINQGKNQYETTGEESYDFQPTTWLYIPPDVTLRNHCCETSNPTVSNPDLIPI